MTDTIRVRAEHELTEATYRIVAITSDAGIEITPSAAVTIASWWQSSGTIGNVLASFASGATVDVSDLLDDIAATRDAHGYNDRSMSAPNRMALDALATFAIRFNDKRESQR